MDSQIRITGDPIRGGNENQGADEFHKEMIAIHKEYEAFRTGSAKMLTWNGERPCVWKIPG